MNDLGKIRRLNDRAEAEARVKAKVREAELLRDWHGLAQWQRELADIQRKRGA